MMTLENFLDSIGSIKVDESAELMVRIPIWASLTTTGLFLPIQDVYLNNGVLVVDLENG